MGNYSIDSRCSWLIDAGSSNSTIRLHIEEFGTECGWDYLYVFDGDSIHSPLVAVLRFAFLHCFVRKLKVSYLMFWYFRIVD